jgi:hypothetical protein
MCSGAFFECLDPAINYGLDVPVPAGEVGTRALGLEPAAGSFGVFVEGPGWTFSSVVGSAGMPAGDEVDVPSSPVLAP